MEVAKYLQKFKLLLHNVTEGKITLNDYYMERLLHFLEDVTLNSPGQLLLETPWFSDIIFNNVQNIQNASTTVRVFLFELITILLKKELQFSKMQLQGFQALSVTNCVLEYLSTGMIPQNLHLACIKLATAHIHHCSGISLLLKHKVWQHVLRPKIHLRPTKIADAAYTFISKLAWKLNDCSLQTELLELLEFVVRPIKASDYNQAETINPEIDKINRDKVITPLKALLAILKETEKMLTENHVVPLLKRQLLTEHLLFKMVIITKCMTIARVINENLTRLCVANYSLLYCGKIDDFCNITIACHHNYLKNLIAKRSVPVIIDYLIQRNIVWTNVEKTLASMNNGIHIPLTFERNGYKLELRDQLTAHLGVPILSYPLLNNVIPESKIDELGAMLGKTVTEHIYSSIYTFKELVTQHCNLKQTTIHAIREFSRLKGHLSEAQAGKLFLCLYYVLEIFIESDGAGGLILSESPLQNADDNKLLTQLLNILQMLLKEHNLSWYENVEIVDLQAGLMNLLKQNILQATQIVQVLDLIDLCMKKFLSPYMTLLVECKQDSTLNEIGAIMTTYIQHEEWEVRDSALNLLLSCTDIAFIKYIPLQKVINENHLILHAARVALTDLDFYAQTTALKCLATAAKIACIWREVIGHDPKIYMELLYIARNNPEGMVRTEAVNAITQIYTNHQTTQSFKNTLYEIMVITTLHDLHWEVQLAALKFWNHAIQNQLTNRGMIDGKFPSVTFSKEKRKIVMLDDKEITRSLECIMGDLSSIGCLTVLLECMNEDQNIEVMEKAYCMTRELMKILDNYKFQKISENAIMYQVDEDIKEEVEDMSVDRTHVERNEVDSDKIIDELLNTNQSDLIMDLHDSLSNLKAKDVKCPIYVRKENVHPNKFIEKFRGTDYLSIIKSKKNWNKEVGSLDAILDEILNL